MNMPQSSHANAPMRPIDFAPVDVICEPSADGSLRLSSRIQLGSYDPSLANLFRSAVDREAGRVFLAERVGEGWRKITYEQARLVVDALAAALIERGLSADWPLMILSGNGIDHALLMLAGFTAGIPIAPISVAYSLQSQDHGKLKYIAELLTPGLVYVSDTGPFARALAAIKTHGAVASRNTTNLTPTTGFDELAKMRPTRAADEAAAHAFGRPVQP